LIIKKRYWNIAKRLSTVQLQKESSDQPDFSESDLFNINIGQRGNSFFLGYYSYEGLKLVFEKYGIMRELAEKGFTNVILKVDTSDPYIHKLTLYDRFKKPDKVLVEVVLRRQMIEIQMPFKTPLNGRKYEVLSIEWMEMQNPNGSFTKERPRLPGQHFPGLGMASKAIELLMVTAWRLNLAGLLNTPQNYHNAYLYSRIFFYINPEDQARLKAMKRDLGHWELARVAWAIERGEVHDAISGQILQWPASKQIVPLNTELKALFNSRIYRKFVRERAKSFKFEFIEK